MADERLRRGSTLKRRRAARRIAALGAVLALAAGACDGGPPPVRSVVLLSLDTLRADHLGAYGYERDTSPQIDALAASGVVFERAISQASSTLPAHRALFRSRVASRADGDSATLAEVLAARGLRTAAFTGGGNVSAAFGFDRGFERYVDDPRGFGAAFDDVEIWLREHADEPFFLFVHTYDIHLPYDPPPPFDAMFAPDYRGAVSGPRTRPLLRKLRRHREYAGFEGEVALDEADRHRVVALYDGGIRYTDAFVGRLVWLLEELGLDASTAVVLLSDHGEEFWEHGSVLHSHTVYQELVHVPLIVALPGGWGGGRRVTQTVRLMDVAPTVLALLGMAPPADFEGRSLLPLLRGEPAAAPPVAVSEIRDWGAASDGRFKLVRRGGGGSDPAEERLYDLAADPGERTDVAARHPDEARRLRAALAEATGLGPEAGFVPEVELEGVAPGLLEQLEALGYVDE